MSAALSRITIYPIKSLDGIDVESAKVLANGALENDRRFALVDADGKYVNGKRTAAVHAIRAEYDLDQFTVRFNEQAEFSLREEVVAAGEWLSEAVGITCRLTENATTGFPDDTDSPGPTLISTATLSEVAGWFPDLTLDETRPRFRANLEIARSESGEPVEPFWEDRLVGPAGTAIPFHIGNVHWLGINPCQRCVVPTRDAITAAAISGFQKAFARNREQHLPTWAPRDRFNHFYRLAVNTQLASGQSSAAVRVGDAVSIDPH